MIIGIMQPYFFPYIGYFQLINAVDKFIIYDDVNYIKQGWINRNRILLDAKPFYFTLNLKEASSFKEINQIQINIKANKLLKTIYQAYNKALYFSEVFPLIEEIINFKELNLSKFVSNSIIAVSKHLGIETNFIISSDKSFGKEFKAHERIIEICKYYCATEYYNAIGGKEFYSREIFENEGIDLKFLKTNNTNYRQFNNTYVPFLSIIDVMFFNSKNEIKKLLFEYELV